MSGPARRRRIEDAALAVFSAKGYGAASMGEIAEAAGVTRSVLYEHFATKRVLFLTVLGTQNAALVAHMGTAITAAAADVRACGQLWPRTSTLPRRT
ncbi:TetR/AcrR family transcriptional regulator [Yinghuangia aomiensis]